MIVGKTPNSGYPDPFATETEKASPEYGMAFAEYIGKHWFNGGTVSANTRFGKRRAEIDRINSHKEGTVDPIQFADILGMDVDVSSKAFDMQVLSYAPKYINLAVDNVSDSIFGIRVVGTDRYASELREGYKDEVRKEMLFRQYAQQFSQASGMEFEVQDDIPENEEELELSEKLDFKTNYEIAAEECVNRVFQLNEMDEISNQCIEDYVCHGEMVAQAEYDNQIGVKLNYIDIRNFISSTNTDKSRSDKGAYWQGVVKQIPLVELERKIHRKLTSEEKRLLKNYSPNDSETLYDSEFIVDVLDFAFKATKEDVYKKRWNDRGGYRMIKKDADWNPPKGRESIKMSDRYETWYGGLHVIGSRLLFNYGELKYMTRERGEQGRVLPPFIHYRSSTQAIGKRLEPIWKELHIIHMQMQRITTSLRASGYAYDIDAMVNIEIGNGKTLKPHDLIKIHNESGNFYYSGSTMGGDQVRIPITQIAATDMSSLNELITQWNHYVNEANGVVGYNEYSLGTANLKSVGVNSAESARAATQTATKHIFNGWYSWYRQMAEATINRTQDAFLYGNINALIAPLIGKVNLEELQKNYFMHKAQFSAIVQVKPTAEEKQMALRRLEQAVQTGMIEPDDAAKIELEIENPQRFAQVLSTLKKRRRKEAQKAEQAKAQQEMQAIQAKAQGEQQNILTKIQAESRANQELEMLKQRGDIEQLKYEWENRMRLAMIERDSSMNIARMKGGIENEKENRKDLRSMKEADAQSAIAAQKVNNPSEKTNLEQEEKIKKQFEQQQNGK